MEITPSYYEILSVNIDCSSEQIKQAYRKLAHQHHPDKGGSKEVFQQINTAYQVLIDPIRREEYDYMLSQHSYINTQSHTTTYSSWENRQKYDEYGFPSDEYSNQIAYLLNNVTSYIHISEILRKISPLLENINSKWDKNDSLKYTSTIAAILMSVVINDANKMIQNYHAYVDINRQGLESAYQKLKEIGGLRMDNETAKIYSKNKRDLGEILRQCSAEKIKIRAKITTIIVLVFFVIFVNFMNSSDSLSIPFLPIVFLLAGSYYILFLIIAGILSIINSLYWYIKTSFN